MCQQYIIYIFIYTFTYIICTYILVILDMLFNFSLHGQFHVYIYLFTLFCSLNHRPWGSEPLEQLNSKENNRQTNKQTNMNH